MILQSLFSGFLRHGALGVVTAGGRRLQFGAGEPDVVIRFHDRLAEWQLVLNPDLRLGELYMDGRLTLEKGDVADLLALLMRNLSAQGPRGLVRAARFFRWMTRRFAQFNPAARSKAQFAAIEAQAQRVDSIDAEMHVDDNGIVITSQTTLK